jgi:ABC-type branched-subunit amino acid transport system ATPase component
MLATRLQRSSARAVREAKELRAEAVLIHFVGVKAVDGVDLVLRRGEILGLIGPNGAGKTTLVNALSGFQKPTAGRVFLDDTDVTGWQPHKLGRKGLARTFQGVRVFAELTAFENVKLGALGTGASHREADERASGLLKRMGLSEKADQKAGALPYGDERRVGLLRALASAPSFLLLDEPAAGLNESESDALMLAISEFRDQFGLGVLVIEHDMRVIMGLCERIQVLDYGKTISVGTPIEVQNDPAVRKAYLGAKRGGGGTRADETASEK